MMFTELREPKPLFTLRAETTLTECISTFYQRGAQYGDTWANSQHLTLKAVANELGATIPDDAFRAIAAAVLVDAKHQRMEGGYKADNLVDGINYSAFLAAEVDYIKRKREAKSE